MKQSHLVTPRTLAETTFETGYTSSPSAVQKKERLIGRLTIAALFALALIFAVAGR